MRILVISNDVIPGFGVPVAAPGLRAAGLAEGLAAHRHQVSIAVPEDLLRQVFPNGVPPAPIGSSIVSPPNLMAHIEEIGAEVVVFINANLSSHLRPLDGAHFVYDLFAPKVLEGMASASAGRTFGEVAQEKERALALADSVWVNGKRKTGYAVGWLLRDEVDRIRTQDFAKPSLRSTDVTKMISLVEMPVPLPEPIQVDYVDTAVTNDDSKTVRRFGIAGYAQAWSSLSSISSGHQAIIDGGHELHCLTPQHWGGNPADAPTNALPDGTIFHDGPLMFEDFARWVQSMDLMVDVFEPSSERFFAMITRSAVALRLGVPLVHAVDSEIADLVEFYDAGWVLDPQDQYRWEQIAKEARDDSVLSRKRRGARRISNERFDPSAALAEASARLGAGF